MKLSAKWPFRQDDPDWKNCEMWHRPTIIDILVSKNRLPESKASEWIRKFKGDKPDKPGKNNIGNEGCFITTHTTNNTFLKTAVSTGQVK